MSLLWWLSAQSSCPVAVCLLCRSACLSAGQQLFGSQRLRHLTEKKSKGGGQKKGPGSVIDIIKPSQDDEEQSASPHTTAAGKLPYEDAEVVMINLLIIENYRQKIGRPIMEGGDMLQLTKDLYEAPFALLFHNNFVVDEPVLMYANKAAQDLFQTAWESMIGTPSKNTASPEEQAQRQKLIDECAEKGFAEIRGAPRVGAKGRKLDLTEAVVFNIEGPDGNKVGQATVIDRWTLEDGTEGGPNAVEPAVNEGMLQEAQSYVEQQADVVRELKEGRGLSNADAEVQAAVQELQRRKNAAERIQATLENGSPVVDQLPEPAASTIWIRTAVSNG